MEWKVGPSSPEGLGGRHFSAVGEVPSTLRVPAAATVSTSGASNAPPTSPKKLTTQMSPDTSNVSRGAIVPAENHQFRQEKKQHPGSEKRRPLPEHCPAQMHPSSTRISEARHGPGSAPTWVSGVWTAPDPLPETTPRPCIPSLSRPGNPRVLLTEPSDALAPTLSPRAFQHTSKMPPVPR